MQKINSREEYHKILQGGMLKRDKCPFCEPLLEPSEVLWTGKFWRIMHNKYPYTGNRDHIMAIPIAHKKFPTEFSREEFSEFTDVHTFVADFFGDKIYFSFTRENFNETTADGRSVEHYHIHFLPGNLKGKFLRKMLELQWFPITQDLHF